MLLLDYQNVLIESLLKDRFSGYATNDNISYAYHVT